MPKNTSVILDFKTSNERGLAAYTIVFTRARKEKLNETKYLFNFEKLLKIWR